MLKTTPGALDGGITVKVFEEGKIYNTEDMEGLDKIFLDIKAAEEYQTPVEVLKRQEKMLDKAPENKIASPPSYKKLTEDFFSDMRAGQIRAFAHKRGVSLEDVPANTSKEKLAKIFVERQ